MTDSRQGTPGPKQDKVLEENPEVGQSIGAYATSEELDDAEGDNTVEGDVENDPQAHSSVNPNRVSRTNP